MEPEDPVEDHLETSAMETYSACGEYFAGNPFRSRVTALGNAPQRASNAMKASSKVTPVHQNVVVFNKGKKFDKAIAEQIGVRACDLDGQ